MAAEGQSPFQAEESSSEDAMPECNRSTSSVSQTPVFKTLIQQATGCVTCGKAATTLAGEGEALHRLKQDGVVRHHCSRCILFLFKGMYCSICFMVYSDAGELGDPALWLTCSKCERLSHLECARARDIPTDSLFFTCHECANPKKPTPATDSGTGDAGVAHKKPRLNGEAGSSQASCVETLAAARIVAILAVKHAKDAKIRARTCAAASAKASAHAKAALDAAYRAALEEARYRHELPKTVPYPGKVLGTPPYTGPSSTTTTMRGILSIHDHPRPVNPERLPIKNYNIGSAGMSKTSFTAPYPKLKSQQVGNSPLLQKVQLSQPAEQIQRQDKPLAPNAASVSVSVPPAGIVNSTNVLENPHSTSSTLPDRGERTVTAHCPLAETIITDNVLHVVSGVPDSTTAGPAIDDFVDVGLLLEEDCGKEKLGDAEQKDPVVIKTGAVCLEMNKEGSDFLQTTNDDSFVQEMNQLTSSTSSGEQGVLQQQQIPLLGQPSVDDGTKAVIKDYQVIWDQKLRISSYICLHSSGVGTLLVV